MATKIMNLSRNMLTFGFCNISIKNKLKPIRNADTFPTQLEGIANLYFFKTINPAIRIPMSRNTTIMAVGNVSVLFFIKHKTIMNIKVLSAKGSSTLPSSEITFNRRAR